MTTPTPIATKQPQPKRHVREHYEQMAAEAALCAPELGLRVPTMDEVRLAERCASGHVDYGSKWAFGVASVMRRKL